MFLSALGTLMPKPLPWKWRLIGNFPFLQRWAGFMFQAQATASHIYAWQWLSLQCLDDERASATGCWEPDTLGQKWGKQSHPKTHSWVKDAIWTKLKRTQFESKQVGTFISHLQTIFSLSIPGSNIYRMPETWRFWHFKGSPRSQLVVFSIPSTFEVQTSKAVGSHKPKNNRMWTWETYDFLKQAWMGLPGMPLGYANLQL